MKREQTTDLEWLHWIEVQKKAIQLSYSPDFEAAIGEVNAFLKQATSLDLKRQAIGFRGDLWREQGDLQAARNDFLAAQSLSERPDFERFTLESAIGRISEQLGEPSEAERWYFEALRTASEDPTTCGVSALKRLTQLRGSLALSPEERILAEKVVVQGWRVLRLPGEPDLTDLFGAAQRINQAEGKPLPSLEQD